MKIIILGAGRVGSTLAEQLTLEDHDITVVDPNPTVLDNLKDRLDIGTLVGHGAHPKILEQAGAHDADMLLAVTDSDETNMLACQIAYTLYQTPTKIARVRTLAYSLYEDLFCKEALPVDVLISPEQLVTEYVARLIEYPGALQVIDFADGKLQMAAVYAHEQSPLVGLPLHAAQQEVQHLKTRIMAIFRRGKAICANSETCIEPQDEVFFLAASSDLRAMMAQLTQSKEPYRRVMLAGGGSIGSRLAQILEDRFVVKLIDKRAQTAQELAHKLNKTIVLLGDPSDEVLLQDENIQSTDVFCSVSNDDEANIMSAVLAKQLGAHKVMALVNHSGYIDMIQGTVIDVVVSPRQTTVSGLLRHIRRGDVVQVHSLRHGTAEAMEAIAHGDLSSSNVVGRPIKHIKLPPGCSIVALVHEDVVTMAEPDTVIESNDHVIIFIADKRRVREVEQLFQVAFSFF